MGTRLTIWIIAALALGVLAGGVVHTAGADEAQRIASYFSIVSDLFLRLIKMLIAPLVLSTLTVGIAHMGDGAAIGRIGARTMLWFVGASFVSLCIGLVMVRLLEPGVGVDLAATAAASSPVAAQAFELRSFVTHLVPTSLIDAMARNEILQIVVFALFAGAGLAAMGERAAPLTTALDVAAQLMLTITGYVMRLAPVAVFAAITAVVATNGLSILWTFGKFIGGFYLSLAILWGALALAASLVLGRRVIELLDNVRAPALLAFSTSSSEAAFPRTLERLERFGVPNRIASFVLPLGYSFNLDGSMMYCGFAAIFIAQAYGIELSFAEQVAMLLLLMVTSKGMAGVPRASLVVIAGTLAQFDIPEAGLLLILGIDQFLDMGRSATNVIGNAIASAVVAKWEGALGQPQSLEDALAGESEERRAETVAG